VTVNIGHFRTDTPIKQLKANNKNSRYILLIRNPADVVISRCFRKTDYRNEVAPASEDEEYLSRQISYVDNFYKNGLKQPFDKLIRYELLKKNSYVVLHDLLNEFCLPFISTQLQTASVKHHHDNIKSKATTNLNSDPLTVSALKFRPMVESRLKDIMGELGYM